MRILGIGDYGCLGSVYLRLMEAGHDVKVHVSADVSRDTLEGLVDRTDDWRAHLPWVRAAGAEGLVLFESAQSGVVQDALRAEGHNIIGGSAFGDRLETERAFGQEIMRDVGMQTAAIHYFADFNDGIAFVRKNPKRYVYKPNGITAYAMDSYIGELDDGADVITVLEMQKERWAALEAPNFILMEHLTGVEVGVGAYFNGEEFLKPACIDWEHKRFFAGDMGELTGEMGTLVSYRGADVLFEATLAKMAPLLARSGYCGYININTIVNDRGIWPLEFTARFGYPGSAILEVLQAEGWDSIFSKMLSRGSTTLATHDGYAAGVVLTVPPFPYDQTVPPAPRGLPIHFRRNLSDEERRHLHFSEVAMKSGRLVTAGITGQVMVATGRAAMAEDACARAYDLAGQVVVPNLRYRLDIGERFLRRDRAEMVGLGLLSDDLVG
jgi:phosphoribosylamine--glycine ligase